MADTPVTPLVAISRHGSAACGPTTAQSSPWYVSCVGARSGLDWHQPLGPKDLYATQGFSGSHFAVVSLESVGISSEKGASGAILTVGVPAKQDGGSLVVRTMSRCPRTATSTLVCGLVVTALFQVYRSTPKSTRAEGEGRSRASLPGTKLGVCHLRYVLSSLLEMQGSLVTVFRGVLYHPYAPPSLPVSPHTISTPLPCRWTPCAPAPPSVTGR